MCGCAAARVVGRLPIFGVVVEVVGVDAFERPAAIFFEAVVAVPRVRKIDPCDEVLFVVVQGDACAAVSQCIPRRHGDGVSVCFEHGHNVVGAQHGVRLRGYRPFGDGRRFAVHLQCPTAQVDGGVGAVVNLQKFIVWQFYLWVGVGHYFGEHDVVFADVLCGFDVGLAFGSDKSADVVGIVRFRIVDEHAGVGCRLERVIGAGTFEGEIGLVAYLRVECPVAVGIAQQFDVDATVAVGASVGAIDYFCRFAAILSV